MYRGFSLRIDEEDIKFLKSTYRNSYSQDYGSIIWNALRSNIAASVSIDADELKRDWFPSIKADVFLSHSHKDIELARSISQILSELHLDAFIDSEVWGYSDDLVKEIERQYYPNGASHVHDKIVSHVNIMLASALTKMLDNTECVIFLNTPNSITPGNNGYSGANRTDSAWIYHELFTTSVLPVHSPIRKYYERPGTVVNEANQPQILYTPPLEHLTELDDSDFKDWVNKSKNSRYHALDVLYSLNSLTWGIRFHG